MSARRPVDFLDPPVTSATAAPSSTGTGELPAGSGIAAALGGRPCTRCADCRTLFPRDEVNTRCRSCRDQLPLLTDATADTTGDPA